MYSYLYYNNIKIKLNFKEMIGVRIFKRYITTNVNISPHLTEFFEKRSTTKCFDNFFISKVPF